MEQTPYFSDDERELTPEELENVSGGTVHHHSTTVTDEDTSMGPLLVDIPRHTTNMRVNEDTGSVSSDTDSADNVLGVQGGVRPE